MECDGERGVVFELCGFGGVSGQRFNQNILRGRSGVSAEAETKSWINSPLRRQDLGREGLCGRGPATGAVTLGAWVKDMPRSC